jgi:hypothetical protein
VKSAGRAAAPFLVRIQAPDGTQEELGLTRALSQLGPLVALAAGSRLE